jgi:hypothetical protein
MRRKYFANRSYKAASPSGTRHRLAKRTTTPRPTTQVAGGRASSACIGVEETCLMGEALLVFTCAACRAPAQANPNLVMSIAATWNGREYVSDPNGKREPVCESCARQLLARFVREHLPVPPVVQEPDYFERAYHRVPMNRNYEYFRAPDVGDPMLAVQTNRHVAAHLSRLAHIR